MDKNFKIFVFIICNDDEIGVVKRLFDKEKYLHVIRKNLNYIILISYLYDYAIFQFADRYNLDNDFLKLSITKIVKTHLFYYTQKNFRLENLKKIFLLQKINLFDNENDYYLSFSFPEVRKNE